MFLASMTWVYIFFPFVGNRCFSNLVPFAEHKNPQILWPGSLSTVKSAPLPSSVFRPKWSVTFSAVVSFQGFLIFIRVSEFVCLYFVCLIYFFIKLSYAGDCKICPLKTKVPHVETTWLVPVWWMVIGY